MQMGGHTNANANGFPVLEIKTHSFKCKCKCKWVDTQVEMQMGVTETHKQRCKWVDLDTQVQKYPYHQMENGDANGCDRDTQGRDWPDYKLAPLLLQHLLTTTNKFVLKTFLQQPIIFVLKTFLQ